MGSLFISHSAQDGAAATELRGRLVTAGYEAAFLDIAPRAGLVGGQQWEVQLYRQLRACDALIFLATPASVESRWCFAEVALARSIGKPVVPLGRDPAVTLPLLVDTQMIHAVDDDERWAALVRSLQQLGVTPDLSFGWDPTRSPYPGLEAFQPEDAGVFFGRDDEIRALAAHLRPTIDRRAGQAVTVAGPSGCGKSSLVRAGLVARLRRSADFHVLPVITPGTDPIGALAGALATGWPGQGTVPRREVARWIADDPGTALGDHVADRMDALGGDRRLVLVVDQLEEMLRSEADVQQRFVAALAAVQAAPVPATAVVTVRSHFLEGCQLAAPGGFLSFLFGVATLDRARLGPAVRRPAEAAGLEVADEVVEAVVAETSTGDVLPLTAYTMRTLYEDVVRDGGRVVTMARYDRLGGVVGAMSGQADRTFALVAGRHDREIVWRTLLKLVAVGPEREPVRRQVLLEALDRDERDVIEAFTDARLLAVGEAGTVGVAHEALFRRWGPLVAAIEDATDQLQVRTELESATRRWLAAGCAPGRLLPVDRLDEALRWARTNPYDLDDLPELGRFLQASQQARHDLLARRAAAVAEHVLAGYPTDLARRTAIVVELADSFPDADAVELAARDVHDRDACRFTTPLPAVASGFPAVSRSGTEVATATVDGRVVVVDLLEPAIAAVVDVGPVRALQLLAPDLVACLRADTIEVYRWTSGTVVRRIDHPGPITAMTGNGADRLVTADGDGTLRWWSADGEQPRMQELPGVAVAELALSAGVVAVLDRAGELAFVEPDGTVRGVETRPPARGLTAVGDAGFVLIDRATPPRTTTQLLALGLGGARHTVSWSAVDVVAASATEEMTLGLVVHDDDTMLLTYFGNSNTSDAEDRQLTGPHPPVRAVVRAATTEAFVTTGGAALTVWRSADRRVLTARFRRGVRGVAFSRDGTKLVSVGLDGHLFVWQVVDGRLRSTVMMSDQFDVLSRPLWSADDASIVVLVPDGVWIWSAEPGQSATQVATDTPPTACALTGPDDGRLVVAVTEGPARVWDWASGDELDPLPESADVTTLVGTAGLLCGLVRDRDGILVWHDTAAPPLLYCADHRIVDLAIAADGRILAAATDGRLLELSPDGATAWTSTGERLEQLDWWPAAGLAVGVTEEGGLVVHGRDGRTTSTGPRNRAVAVREDGLVVAGDDNGWLEVTAMAADSTARTEIEQVRAHAAGLVDVRWAADDSAVLVLTEDTDLARYPLRTFDEPQPYSDGSWLRIARIVTLADGTLLTASIDGALRGAGPDGTVTVDLPVGSLDQPRMAADPDGGFVTVEPDGRLRRFTAEGTEAGGRSTGTTAVAVSCAADGRWAVLGEDGTVVTGIADGETARWRWAVADPDTLALSPDGTWVALAGGAGVEIRAATGRDDAALWADGATRAAWSPDGRLVAIGFGDGAIELRRVGSWRPVRRITAPRASIRCLEWSHSGRFLASGCSDGLLVVDEHVTMPELTARLRSRVQEPISAEERDRYGLPPTLTVR